MLLSFSKYQGAGNDFIMIDNRSKLFPTEQAIISRLCDRHFGIGSDGLILLESIDNYDFSMVYFNSDGRESTLCGNGGRCITAFARDLKIIEKRARFHAVDGEHICLVTNDSYHLGMSDVTKLETNGSSYFINTGSPHHVEFCEDIENMDVVAQGRAIRNSLLYAPHGCNVNFAECKEDSIHIRTYERGVENETLACGTGATAVALAANSAFGIPSPVSIKAVGGNLEVKFLKTGNGYTQIFLCGPAKKVFDGKIEI